MIIAFFLLSLEETCKALKTTSDIAIPAVNYRSHCRGDGEERKQSPSLFLFWRYSCRLSDLQVTTPGLALEHTCCQLHGDVECFFCIISILLLPSFRLIIHRTLFCVVCLPAE